VTITPELLENLRTVAAAFGQAPATVASMAIGSYVANQLRSLNAGTAMVERMATEMAPELKAQLSLLVASAEAAEPPPTPAKRKGTPPAGKGQRSRGAKR